MPLVVLCLLFASAWPMGIWANVIQDENAKEGTTDWILTRPADGRQIEGYASLTSVNIGSSIELFVNTLDKDYTLEVYRMGWYQGKGARRMLGPVLQPGTRQRVPGPDLQGLIECQWTNGVVISIPSDWVSGYYLVKLRNGGAPQHESYIPFVVRDDQRDSDYLFQAAFTTYQAYNNWPGPEERGKSLYAYNSWGRQAQKVSFDRPYGRGKSDCTLMGVGAGDFLTHDWDEVTIRNTGNTAIAGWEYSMIRWMEREGYDVSYCTDLDSHEDGSRLLHHRAFLSVGHDEYWSREMRLHVEAAQAQGIHLGFFGANYCFWQVRFESNAAGQTNRVMVGYKNEVGIRPSPDDPLAGTLLATFTFENLYTQPTSVGRVTPGDWPEEALAGGSWRGDSANSALQIGNTNHWVFAGAGLSPGDRLPGLVGYEFNFNARGLPEGRLLLARSPASHADGGRAHFFVPEDRDAYSDMTLATGTNGAVVFNAGTVQWSWGLDDFMTSHWSTNTACPLPSMVHFGVQQMTRNILSRFVSSNITEYAIRQSTNVPGFAVSLSGNRLTPFEFLEVQGDVHDFNLFPLTATAWVKTTDLGTDKGILNKYTLDAHNGWNVYLTGGCVRACYYNDINNCVGGVEVPLEGGFIADGKWHHIGLVVDLDGGRLYVDGDLKHRLPWVGEPAAPTTTVPVHFGEYYHRLFEGALDEIVLWQRALSTEQMRNLRDHPLSLPQPGLVGYWQFDAGYDGEIAMDSSGHGHHAHLPGHYAWTPSAAPLSPVTNSGAMRLGGREQYLISSHDPRLNAYPITVMAWIRTSDTNDYKGVLGKYLPATLNGYQLLLHEGRIRGWYFRGEHDRVFGSNYGFDGGFVSDDRWHHLAMVVDGSGGRLYVDAELRDAIRWEGTPGPPTTSAELRMGEYADRYLDGQLDEVRIWNRAFSQKQLWEGIRNGFQSEDPSLLVWWEFNDGVGLVARDSSGLGHSAILLNGADWVTASLPSLLPEPKPDPDDGNESGGGHEQPPDPPVDHTTSVSEVILTWDVSAATYQLEFTPGLEMPMWNVWTNLIVPTNGPFQFKLSTTNTSGFFRLAPL